MNNTATQLEQAITRRTLLGQQATGLGALALASLLNRDVSADTPTAAGKATAKRVIFLFQSGGPSQFETFDHKPKLNELDGAPMPASLTNGERLAQIRGHELKIVGSKFTFAKHGQSGAQVSELLPHTAKIVDDISIVRSMHTEAINHDPAVTFMQTGHTQPGRPCFGSWMSYGLGSENDELPTFVVLPSGMNQGQPLHARYWTNGFLPGQHQGTLFRPTAATQDPILFLSNPPGISESVRRRQLDGMAALNRLHHETIGDPAIATRIAAFEMAYRMQRSVPELLDTTQESKETLEMYGPDVETPGTFAANCLLARRLAERDVRFIQLYHRGWDQHTNLPEDIAHQCKSTDQASAALVRDLKRHGLLEDTLVIWAGEFGRTPMLQATPKFGSYGRDHHLKCFSLWLAGGGIKAGQTVGKSDELGYEIAEDPIHVHDLHATLLHCLGIDHKELTYPFQGRDFRLTDVSGEVVRKLLA
jgi:hypothetical protein